MLHQHGLNWYSVSHAEPVRKIKEQILDSISGADSLSGIEFYSRQIFVRSRPHCKHLPWPVMLILTFNLTFIILVISLQPTLTRLDCVFIDALFLQGQRTWGKHPNGELPKELGRQACERCKYRQLFAICKDKCWYDKKENLSKVVNHLTILTVTHW